MSPLGKRIAELHNEAAGLARRLKTLAADVSLLELNVQSANLEQSDRRAFDEVRQTACAYCGLDIEGFKPFKKGEWRDRGNNTHCPTGDGRAHSPYKEHCEECGALVDHKPGGAECRRMKRELRKHYDEKRKTGET